jgi:hypothetical protein
LQRVVVTIMCGAEEQGAMPVVMEIVPVRWRWRSTAQKKKGYTMSHYSCM